MSDERRLSDEELADVAARVCDGACHVCDGSGRLTNSACGTCQETGLFALQKDTMLDIITELTALRALLQTPMPCGFDEPRITPDRGYGPRVIYNTSVTEEQSVTADNAVALGAALVRAGLQARGDK